MKTAISIDDQLMGEADNLAQRLGLSRSGLLSRALEEFLRARRGEALTAKLNHVYSHLGTASRTANSELLLPRKFNRAVKLRDRW